jgi:phosphopantetheinyl transferase
MTWQGLSRHLSILPSRHGLMPKNDCTGHMFAGRIFSAGLDDFESLIKRSDCLSSAERGRAHRFHRPADASAFIARRVFLREVLANALDVRPSDVEVAQASNGKPHVSCPKEGPWFNLSATTGRVVVALSRAGEVGVDVEWLGRPLDHIRLARRWFTPTEALRLERCTSVEGVGLEFTCTWTAREAAAKLTGEGMALALPRYEVIPDPVRVVRHDGGPTIPIELRVEPPYVVSIAWSSPISC